MVKKVSLAPKLDTAAAADLRDTLVDAKGQDVTLDASAVEMIGAKCLELLMSAGVLWKADGHAMTVENASSKLTDDLVRIGLTPDQILEFTA